MDLFLSLAFACSYMHAGMGDTAIDLPGGEPRDPRDNTAKRVSRAGEAPDAVLGWQSAAGIGSTSSSESDGEGRLWYMAAELSDSREDSPAGPSTPWDPYLESETRDTGSVGTREEATTGSPNRPAPPSKRRRDQGATPQDWDVLDISFTEAHKLADALAASAEYTEDITSHGIYLWKIQHATMLPDERNTLEQDLKEELQGRHLAERIIAIRRVLHEFELDLFHTHLQGILQNKPDAKPKQAP